jgi:glycosyltransferase involved in cell wall biosynthesis
MARSQPNTRIDRMPSILFVSSDRFPPVRVDVSVLFGKELARRGYQLDFLLQSEGQCERSYEAKWENCRVWVGRTDNGASRLRRIRKHVLSILHDLRLLGLSRQRRYDVLQVKDKFISAIAAVVAARLSDAKFVYWLSYPFPEASLHRAREGSARYPVFYRIRGHAFRILLYSVILPLADHVFVQSEEMKNDVARKGIAREKMTAVPMGVSLEMFPDLALRPGADEPTETAAVYIGTLQKVRRLDILVRAFSGVVAALPEAKLYLIGDSDEPRDVDELKALADSLGIGSAVVFTGFLPRGKAIDVIKRARIGVSAVLPTPIYNVSSPTKLIEYQACFKACVATDLPDQRLVLEESQSGLCVPYEEHAMADAMLKLLKDPALCREMGLRGRAYVEQNRSYDRLADMLDQEYRNILSKR